MLEQEKMTQWELPGVPAGGLRRVGQIRGTNTLILHAGQNGMLVALELLSTHTPGAPLVDARNEFIGFISEFDVLRALEAGRDLSKLTAEDIMVHDRIAVTAETTIEEAVKTMEDKRLLNLPVKQNRRIAYSVTRHDLLRAWIGIGTSGEE
jgi:predicted transcriptional regulator